MPRYLATQNTIFWCNFENKEYFVKYKIAPIDYYGYSKIELSDFYFGSNIYRKR
jgi:hypothetical protein